MVGTARPVRLGIAVAAGERVRQGRLACRRHRGVAAHRGSGCPGGSGWPGHAAGCQNIVKDFSEEITSTITTPAVEHLFQIQDQNKGTCFHHTIAQLLFVSAMARQDIQTSVAFSTTRVKGPDEDDWGKLKMVLKYLNGTKPLKLTIHAWKLDVVKWYVDALCTIHDDCKGHT